MNKGKLLIFSAPSGSGKSTLVNHLMENIPSLAFSVSATTRAPRGNEQNGVEYYFLTPRQFRYRIRKDAFVEYEEVYKDKFYGTLKSEVDHAGVLGNAAAECHQQQHGGENQSILQQ